LLTPLRHFGRFFSPISLFYCFEETAAGEAINAVVVEVTNTPWREKHWYVLSDDLSDAKSSSENVTGATGSLSFSSCKDFHVSPFFEMGLMYQWKMTVPGESLRVAIRSHPNGNEAVSETKATGGTKPIFVASVDLEQEPLTDRRLLQTILRYPLGPLQTLAAIYFEAWRLWLKKVPYCPHPKSLENQPGQSSPTAPD